MNDEWLLGEQRKLLAAGCSREEVFLILGNYIEEGVFTVCNKCKQRFQLLYDDYGNTGPMTVEIGYCLSGGIYSVSVKCPKCKHEESIK